MAPKIPNLPDTKIPTFKHIEILARHKRYLQLYRLYLTYATIRNDTYTLLQEAQNKPLSNYRNKRNYYLILHNFHAQNMVINGLLTEMKPYEWGEIDDRFRHLLYSNVVYNYLRSEDYQKEIVDRLL